MWKSLRENALTVENVQARVAQYEHELNDSGAKARNAYRWDLEETVADGSGIVSFAADRFALLDRLFEEMAASDREYPMLWCDDYANKYVSLSKYDLN